MKRINLTTHTSRVLQKGGVILFLKNGVFAPLNTSRVVLKKPPPFTRFSGRACVRSHTWLAPPGKKPSQNSANPDLQLSTQNPKGTFDILMFKDIIVYVVWLLIISQRIKWILSSKDSTNTDAVFWIAKTSISCLLKIAKTSITSAVFWR